MEYVNAFYAYNSFIVHSLNNAENLIQSSSHTKLDDIKTTGLNVLYKFQRFYIKFHIVRRTKY